MIGTTVSHYKILERLGVGAMGELYAAEDTKLQRKVALKFLPEALAQDARATARFIREARAASALSHPNICTIYEIDEEEGRLFIAMELLEGATLKTRIDGTPLPLELILDLGIQIADALSLAHHQGIVHRDIKPTNVFVDKRGHVKVLDFGIAKWRAASGRAGFEYTLTTPGTRVGTLSYMSPEQARGEDVDHRTDLFSFGVVLYEMATGRQAFGARNAAATLEALLEKNPQPLAEMNQSVPGALSALVAKALEKGREARYQSAEELAADLRRIQREVESDATVAAAPAAVGSASSAPIASLAILVFENESADGDVEYLCEGLAEELIHRLSQLPNLRVMARSTVFRYRGKGRDPLQLGDELGVQAVLTGRITQRGGALLISAELIEVSNGWQLWGERYDRRLDDLLVIQEEIVREIGRNLRLKLTGEQERRLGRGSQQHAEAYREYLTGRYHWNRWTPEGFERAIQHYQRAIALDPKSGLGHAGLADAWSLLGLYALQPPTEVFPKAIESARRALQLDDCLAEAHAALGIARFFFEWDWPAARGDFQRALELNPGYVPARHLYSTALNAVGHHDEALREAHAALDADPLSLITILNLGWIQFNARKFSDAMAQCRRALELDPSFTRAHELLALAALHAGQTPTGLAAIRQVIASDEEEGPRRLAVCGYCLALAGERDEARVMVDRLRDLSSKRYVPSLSLAFVSSAVGKSDAAFGWLERSFDERDSLLVWLRVEPRLDNLRQDARFADLVERVGLRLWS